MHGSSIIFAIRLRFTGSPLQRLSARRIFPAFQQPMQKVATRLIHSCGMVDILDDLAFSEGAAEAGVEALLGGCAVYCDVEMVKGRYYRAEPAFDLAVGLHAQ